MHKLTGSCIGAASGSHLGPFFSASMGSCTPSLIASCFHDFLARKGWLRLLLLNWKLFVKCTTFALVRNVQKGRTALHHAAASGSLDRVQVLLAEGADIHAADNVSMVLESGLAWSGPGQGVGRSSSEINAKRGALEESAALKEGTEQDYVKPLLESWADATSGSISSIGHHMLASCRDRPLCSVHADVNTSMDSAKWVVPASG